MITKTLGKIIMLIVAGSVVWYFVDPVSFWQNPVFAALKELSLRSSGYRR